MFDILEKLEGLEDEYQKIINQLSDPEVINDRENYRKLAKEHSRLEEIITIGKELKEVVELIDEDQAIIKENPGNELVELAKEELEEHTAKGDALAQKLKEKLITPDPFEDRDIIVEIRAGTGGEEASLFAGDLFDMYTRYKEKMNWEMEVINSSISDHGGFKEIIFSLRGCDVYKNMKFESGVHRVQRVPETESQGRIHTSAVSVAILPEPKDIDIEIDPNDLEIDTFRSSGPGGQHVNTTDSAIRITHKPTNITVSCQDEKSQHKNKKKAMKILRARVLVKKQEEQQEKIAKKRRLQVGSGDRSQKIRTYNFPQNRVSDHRINFTSHNLDGILAGGLDELFEALEKANVEDLLKEV